MVFSFFQEFHLESSGGISALVIALDPVRAAPFLVFGQDGFRRRFSDRRLNCVAFSSCFRLLDLLVRAARNVCFDFFNVLFWLNAFLG